MGNMITGLICLIMASINVPCLYHHPYSLLNWFALFFCTIAGLLTMRNI